jgi:hypothetical protein
LKKYCISATDSMPPVGVARSPAMFSPELTSTTTMMSGWVAART